MGAEYFHSPHADAFEPAEGRPKSILVEAETEERQGEQGAALFAVLLDTVEIARDLTVFGAGLGRGQFNHASRVLAFRSEERRLRLRSLVRPALDRGYVRGRFSSFSSAKMQHRRKVRNYQG